MKECIFCKTSCEVNRIGNIPYLNVDCKVCGTYKISVDAFDDLPYEIEHRIKMKPHTLSGIIRERFENGLYETFIAMDNFNYILSSAKIPKTITEKLDKLLLFLYKKTQRLNEELVLPSYAICFAIDNEEVDDMLRVLDSQGLLKYYNSNIFSLTVNGLERGAFLEKYEIISKQCFVAMWFETELDKVFLDYIKPAVEGKTLDGKSIENVKSYDPIRIDLKEFNDDIMDAVIAEIRRSKFVIADFTGNRGGVYYEAGFAYGLDIEVIYTCKKSFFEKEKVHFDVAQKKFILWEDGEDLYIKLRNRISAVII